MITLKIKDAGHTVAIPGLQVVRTPVTLDISKLDIRVVSMYLKTSGIDKYEIVAKTPQGLKEIYTNKDFDIVEPRKSEPKEDLNKKFEKLEKMMEILLSRGVGNIIPDREQINNKLDILENLLKDGIQFVDKTPARRKIVKGDELKIEELDSFIPEVDIGDMKLSSDNIKKVKKDDDSLEDSADMLSGLMRRG
ncbi:MAG TPA: hypothetical protein VMX17_08600 [Candidatus Glassbacteria bacterium]|nr:hypothetical protein [Candidatus Glassbacteria bacterium]